MSSQEVSVCLFFFSCFFELSCSMLMRTTSNTQWSPTSCHFAQDREQNKNLSVTALNSLSPWGKMSADRHKWQKWISQDHSQGWPQWGERWRDVEKRQRDRKREEKCRRKGQGGRMGEKEGWRNAWVRPCVPHCWQSVYYTGLTTCSEPAVHPP